MLKKSGYRYVAPVGIWISLFFVLPLLIIAAYSFMAKGLYGGVEGHFSLKAYGALANPALLSVTATTLLLALTATGITLCLAFPAAYFIARSRYKNIWLFMVIIPFWTNFLIRIYAWIAILGNNGFLNQLLSPWRGQDQYVQFLYNRYAVIVVLVYTYLPFAILPLYAAIEKFDFGLLEAARDLGASTVQALVRVLVPNISGGILAAVLVTFIPAFGQYAVPQLVGGRDSYMLGTIIARELTVTRDWPLSAAISMVLTLLTASGVLLYLGMNRRTSRPQETKTLREEA